MNVEGWRWVGGRDHGQVAHAVWRMPVAGGRYSRGNYGMLPARVWGKGVGWAADYLLADGSEHTGGVILR